MLLELLCNGSKRCQLFIVLCVLLPIQSSSAQRPLAVGPPSLKLVPGAPNALNVPPFSWAGSVQCDSRGRAYFGISDPAYTTKLILRLSSSGQEPMPFPLPKDLGDSPEWHFAVSPAGDVYALASTFTNGGENILLKYSTSGDEVSRTTLQLPKGFLINSSAVQSNGSTMLQGFIPHTVKEDSEKSQGLTPKGTSMIAILDQNGHPVSLKDGKSFTLFNGAPGTVAAGNNGTFVELMDETLSIFDQTGDLLKSIQLVKPYPESNATKLEYVDGQFAVAFSRVDPVKGKALDPKHPEVKFGPIEVTWLLLNSEDGTLKGFYSMPADFVGSSLCYLGQGEFLNIAAQNRQAVFVKATAP